MTIAALATSRPSTCFGDLYTHQRRAVAVLEQRGGNGAIWLPMRTGKSRAALAYLDGRANRVLVVCPLSVIGVWEREIAQVNAGSVLSLGYGTVRERAARLRATSTRRFALVNYNSYWRDPLRSALLRWKPDAVIMDEAQRIKHAGTKQARFAHLLSSQPCVKYRLALTGSLVLGGPNGVSTLRLENFYSPCLFVDPSIFGTSFTTFRDRYLVMGGYEGREIRGYKNEVEARRKILDLGHWQPKEECLDLPPVRDVPVPLELSPSSRAVYKTITKVGIAQIDALASDGTPVHGVALARIVLTTMLRQHQITSGHIRLVTGEIADLGSEKLDACAELVEDAVAEGNRVVVFCRFLRDVERVAARLVEVDMLTGATPPHERARLLPGGIWTPHHPILVSQIDVGSLGVDFKAASVAIFLSTGYGLDSFIQARARLHSPGQLQPIVYYHLQCRGTVDERLYALLSRGQVISEATLDRQAAKELLR